LRRSFSAAPFVPAFLPAGARASLPSDDHRRRARNFGWILVINLLLSWTVIGWIVALIWAIRDTPKYVVAYVPPPPPPYNVR